MKYKVIAKKISAIALSLILSAGMLPAEPLIYPAMADEINITEGTPDNDTVSENRVNSGEETGEETTEESPKDTMEETPDNNTSGLNSAEIDADGTSDKPGLSVNSSNRETENTLSSNDTPSEEKVSENNIDKNNGPDAGNEEPAVSGNTAVSTNRMALRMVRALGSSNGTSYLDEHGTQQSHEATVLTNGMTTWTGWYAVTGNVTIDTRITVSGEAHLILCDGAELNASKGITVTGGSNALYIYGQTAGTGKLTATGEAVVLQNYEDEGYYTGIGGGNHEEGGNITINGGEVIATGALAINRDGTNPGGAGIGGGGNAPGRYITINGGKVTATGGEYAAGIGGGGVFGSGGRGEYITINGGEVIAKGGRLAAGIGGGYEGGGRYITINGGKVTAEGGNHAAGIGGGITGIGEYITINGGKVTAKGGSENGAGIGGGSDRWGSDITINGGEVEATGGKYGAGIGAGGKGGRRSKGYAGNITINGGKVTAIGGDYAAGIGGGSHCNYYKHSITINGGEVIAKGGMEAAGIGSGYDNRRGLSIIIRGSAKVSAAGGKRGAAAIGWGRTLGDNGKESAQSGQESADTGGLFPTGSVTRYPRETSIESIIEGSAQGETTTCTITAPSVFFDANGGEGWMDTITPDPGNTVMLPDNGFRRHNHIFTRWDTKADGSGTAYAKSGASITPGSEHVILYAQWQEKTEISPVVSITGWTYGEAANAPSVTNGNPGNGAVTYAYKVKDAADSTYSASVPVYPGNYTVRAIIAETDEYQSGTATADFTISRADHGDVTAKGSAKHGKSGTVDISALIETGGTVGTITKTDADSILSGDPVVTDGTLGFTFVDSSEKTGKSATITVPVTEAKNYNDYSITVTLTVTAKDVPALSANSITKTYDGNAVSGAEITGTAKADGNDIAGTWKFEGDASYKGALESGVKTVVFTPTDNESYETAETTLLLTINRAEVTVKADDKTMVYGASEPELTATVTGLISGDTVNYALSRKPGTEVGTYSITPTGDTIQGNYAVTFETGTLTISDGSNNGKEEKNEENKEDEPWKIKGKVPFTEDGEFYASSLDNFAAESGSGKITGLVLDFSKVAESDVKPSDLKMTAIRGSRFTTKSKLKDKGSASATGGVKVKVNKKTLIPKITCKKDGSVTLTMEDGNTYTVNFKVQKPKAQRTAKSNSKGSSPATKTIKDLFGTDIDAGELKILKQKHSQATLSGNTLMVDPREKDNIKVQYKYLNMKYKLTMKVK